MVLDADGDSGLLDSELNKSWGVCSRGGGTGGQQVDIRRAGVKVVDEVRDI